MRISFSLAALVCLVGATSLVAQPPAPPNPQAPTLAPIVPMGAQRGTSIDLTVTGTNLADPNGVWTSFPGKVTIPTDNNNGKSATSLKIKIELPKDAPLGFHTVRVATKKGMSNARLFCIDDLPEVASKGGNREVKTAHALSVPCVVTARIDAEATDYYKITVKANQRLSFEVLGRRLGSAFDPQITLLDASGNELPGAFSNDAPGLQTDCRLNYLFEKAGDVIVAVRDVSYRGGADFHYRLRIGDFPCATTPLPAAVKRGSKTQVKFSGPHVEGVAVEVQAPADANVDSVQVAPKGTSGLYGWPVVLHLSDLDEQTEKEPNDDAKQANRIAAPAGITGRFEKKDDVDHFVFEAKKGKRYTIEAHTLEHGSPSEVFVAIKNAKGAQVAASNPMAVAPKVDFAAPEDGDYTVVVEHLHSWGGPDEVYRLTVTPAAGAFTLTLNQDRFDVAPGGSFSVPIFLQPAGYTGAVEVSVVGKGLSGTVKIAAPAKQPNQASGTLVVKADDTVESGPASFLIQGKAKIDGKDVTVLASVRNLVTPAMGNLSVPPRHTFTQLGLSVTDKPPFVLAMKFEAANVAAGGAIELTISVTRDKSFTGEVTVALTGQPPGVKMEPAALKIPADQSATKVKLTVPANLKPMAYGVVATGAAKHNNRDWAVRAGPAQLVVVAAKK